MQVIEKVQRRATKLLTDLKDLPYQERLEILNLPSLKFRQIRGDLLQAYKIIHNIDNIDCSNFFSFTSNNTRNNELKIFKQYAKSSHRCNFFTNRVTNFWNNLSVEAKTAPSINIFKSYLDNELHHLKYSFDE